MAVQPSTVPAAGSPPYTGPAPRSFTIAPHAAHFDVRALPSPAIDRRHDRDLPEHEPPDGMETPASGLAPIGSATGGSGAAPAPATSSNFDGLAFNDDCGGVRCGAGHPPDTNGDVGPNYYIESVNTAIAIYDKSTGSRVAAFGFDAFMSQAQFGNLCDTDNFGDPVVLYDTFADRWIITDFAFQLDGTGSVVSPPGSYQCFAVSKTGNPVSGGWNFYSLHVTDALQDYPKFGIWSDGLYMSANMFGFSAGAPFQNVRVWAFNRAQMEAGQIAQVVEFDAPAKSGPAPIFTLLPSNARAQTGTPPAGRENLFASVWYYSARVRIFKFHVDWANTASSTFTGPIDSSTGSTFGSPPGTVPELGGNNLDTLGYRLMMQNQYTNIAGVESLWDSHAVAGSSGSQAAVRFYQVPVTGGTIGSALQAATWNPDSANRWLPSVAIDRAGDMAIGYSVSSSSIHPAIRYAGRLAADPLNTITQTEANLIAGTGAQVGTCGGSACARWGDYSAMTLDPDGCTFWYTNEYYADLSLNDRTRIGSFAFPSCVNSPPPTQPPPTATPSPSPSPGPTIDVTPPSVSSFASTVSSPTSALSIPYALTFSEAVTGLSAADFSHTGTATGCTVGAPSGSGATYTVAVTGCSDGTLVLTLSASAVLDAAGNPGPTSPVSAATVTVATGATFHALNPARLLDTRIGNGLSGRFNAGIARTFQVTGRGGVPANAIGVTGNVTVTGQTAAGFVFLGPVATNSPTSSTINFPLGDTRANGVTVALGGGGTLSATYVAGAGNTTQLIFDVTGYFTP